MRTMEWEKSTQRLKMIDQRELPSEFTFIHLKTYQEVALAIKDMAVRGAPAIGVSAAYGMVLACLQSSSATVDSVRADLAAAAAHLEAARPTAVNLPWALKRMLETASADFDTIEGL